MAEILKDQGELVKKVEVPEKEKPSVLAEIVRKFSEVIGGKKRIDDEKASIPEGNPKKENPEIAKLTEEEKKLFEQHGLALKELVSVVDANPDRKNVIPPATREEMKKVIKDVYGVEVSDRRQPIAAPEKGKNSEVILATEKQIIDATTNQKNREARLINFLEKKGITFEESELNKSVSMELVEPLLKQAIKSKDSTAIRKFDKMAENAYGIATTEPPVVNSEKEYTGYLTSAEYQITDYLVNKLNHDFIIAQSKNDEVKNNELREKYKQFRPQAEQLRKSAGVEPNKQASEIMKLWNETFKGDTGLNS